MRRWSHHEQTTNKFSPEVRTRAVRLVLDHEGVHTSRWAAIVSVSSRIGCTAQTLNEWVKKSEVDSGKRAGVPTEMTEKLKAFEREDRELRQANEILRRSRHICPGGARLPSEAMIAFIGPELDPGSSWGPWGRADLQGVADRPFNLPRSRRQTSQSGEAVSAGEAGHGPQTRDRPGLRGELRRLRCSQGPAAATAGGPHGCPLYGRAADGRAWLAGRDPGQAGAHDDQSQGGALSA